MKTLNQIPLKENERQAIVELKITINTPLFKAMPLCWNINKDGIIL